MFSDPLSITIGGVTSSLPRVSNSENSGTFAKDDRSVDVTVQHRYGKRDAHNYRVNHKKIAPDPLVPANSKPYDMSVSLTVNVPPYGYTPAEIKDVVKGALAALEASSDANLIKLIGGES
jgi:hypothetical protein